MLLRLVQVGKDFHDAFKNAVETLMGFTENFPLGESGCEFFFLKGLRKYTPREFCSQHYKPPLEKVLMNTSSS